MAVIYSHITCDLDHEQCSLVRTWNLQPFNHQPAQFNTWSKPFLFDFLFIFFPIWGLNSTYKQVFDVDEPLVTSKLWILYLLHYSVIERFIFSQWGFHIVIERLFAEWHLYWPSLLLSEIIFYGRAWIWSSKLVCLFKQRLIPSSRFGPGIPAEVRRITWSWRIAYLVVFDPNVLDHFH